MMSGWSHYRRTPNTSLRLPHHLYPAGHSCSPSKWEVEPPHELTSDSLSLFKSEKQHHHTGKNSDYHTDASNYPAGTGKAKGGQHMAGSLPVMSNSKLSTTPSIPPCNIRIFTDPSTSTSCSPSARPSLLSAFERCQSIPSPRGYVRRS